MFTLKAKYHKEILILTLPLLAASISSLILSIVDIILIGRYSVEALVGVSAGATIFSLFSAIISATIVGYQILSARYHGADKVDKVGMLLKNSLWFSGFLSLLSILFLVVFGNYISSLFTNSIITTEQSYLYILSRAPELLILIVLSTLRVSLDVEKKTKYGMYVSFIIAGTNLLLGYILIYGWYTIPSFGIVGAGLSSSLATLVGLIYIILILRRKKVLEKISFSSAKLNRHYFSMVAKLNLPSMGSSFVDYLSTLIIFIILGSLGEIILTGARINFSIIMFLFTIASCFGYATQILASRAIGSGSLFMTKTYIVNSIQLSVVLFSALGLLMVFFPGTFVNLFTSFEIIENSILNSIRVIGIVLPIMAFSSINVAAVRAFGKTKQDFYINLVSTWVVHLPSTLFFVLVLNWGTVGFVLGYGIYFLSRTIGTSIVLIKLSHQKDNLVDEEVEIVESS